MQIEAQREMVGAEKEITEATLGLLDGGRTDEAAARLRVARGKLMTATRLLEEQNDD